MIDPSYPTLLYSRASPGPGPLAPEMTALPAEVFDEVEDQSIRNTMVRDSPVKLVVYMTLIPSQNDATEQSHIVHEMRGTSLVCSPLLKSMQTEFPLPRKPADT